MTYVAYTRVSSKTQNCDLQVNQILSKYSVDKDLIFKEVESDAKNRPILESMLKQLRKGDTLIVVSVDRLARSLIDLLRIVKCLQERQVELISLTESKFEQNPQGILNLNIFAAVAEYQRSMIKARQIEGIELAKLKGKYKGRQRIAKPINFDLCYEKYQMRSNKYSLREFGFDTKLKQSTLWKMIKEKQAQEKQAQNVN
jgi:DNA invertase Pin-like site-specific DNA recombinase